MTDYVVCSTADGSIVKAGHVSDDSLVSYQATTGQVAFAVPDGTVAYPNLNIEPYRTACYTSVDTQAGTIRSNYLTTVVGQAETYIYKANEARAYQADNTTSVPFLTAEAASRGMTVDALATEVLANEAAWISIGSKIEAVRMGAKTKLAAATSLYGMYQATLIDWTAVSAS